MRRRHLWAGEGAAGWLPQLSFNAGGRRDVVCRVDGARLCANKRSAQLSGAITASASDSFAR